MSRFDGDLKGVRLLGRRALPPAGPYSHQFLPDSGLVVLAKTLRLTGPL